MEQDVCKRLYTGKKRRRTRRGGHLRTDRDRIDLTAQEIEAILQYNI